MRELASNFTDIDNKTGNISSTDDNKTKTNINQDNEIVNTDKDNTNSLNEEYKEILDKMSMTTENHTNNLSDEGKKSPGNQMLNKNINNQTSLKGNSKEIQTKLPKLQVKEITENNSNNLIHNNIETPKPMLSNLDKVENSVDNEYNIILSKMSMPDKVTTETEAPFYENVENDSGSFVQR